MSKPTNPMAIGSFVIGAIALLVLGLLLFGGGRLFNRHTIEFVTFFESSLNGLEVGAPVKMQGVKIGTVTEIALQLDPETGKLYKPVVMEVDPTRLLGPGERNFPIPGSGRLTKKTRDILVALGFRARLEMQSLLTGLLFVDLDLHPDRPAQFAGLDYEGLPEMPSVPTTTEEIRSTVDEVARKLREVPWEQMITDLSGTLKAVHDLIQSKDARKSGAALVAATEEIRAMAAEMRSNLKPLLQNASRAMDRASLVLEDSHGLVRDFRGEMRPLLATTGRAVDRATVALNRAETTLATVQGAVGPGSRLEETLVALRDAARSVRELSDYLERHPEALISGKDH